jgi:hypothetical protein
MSLYMCGEIKMGTALIDVSNQIIKQIIGKIASDSLHHSFPFACLISRTFFSS